MRQVDFVRRAVAVVVPVLLAFAVFAIHSRTAAQKPAPEAGADYATAVQPLIKKYCLDCHSTKAKKGSLDLERFATIADVRKHFKVWEGIIEQIEAGEMPPKEKPQPTADEKKKLLAWIRAFLDAEAKSRTGDPGFVPLRRLSNAEYNYTIRDLTNVDLQPAREFPADGAAGEGFTNAAEALTDISPALLTKYLNASKDIADHAVLLPDGFRFSPAKTRRDWTNEGTASLRAFYANIIAGDGRLPVQPYLLATLRHRESLAAGKVAEVATKEKLNAKYLAILFAALNDKTPSQPLDAIRAKWRTATEKDAAAISGDIARYQAALWKTVKVGNYVQASWNDANNYVESLTRQVAVNPTVAESVPIRVAVKPVPSQSEVTLYLAAQSADNTDSLVWHRPRLEAPGKPALLLRDYADFGPAFEIDYASAFANSSQYLAALVDLANDPKANADELAKQRGLNATFLKQWAKTIPLSARKKPEDATRDAVPLTLLDDKTGPSNDRPAISGWKKKGIDLPIVLANSSDKLEQIPGRVSARTIGVHPTPQECVAVAWKSPVAGTVRVAARVFHAHPACGNGVAWWLEHRRGNRATVLGEGDIDLGKEAKPPAQSVKVEKGDILVLAVDPRNGEHTCDMTEIWFTITEEEKPNRVWDLAADVATNIQASNPHADKHGNADTWSFVRSASKKASANPAPAIPANSVLARWRTAAVSPTSQAETAELAKAIEKLLSGPRPADEKNPDRVLYDRLVAVDSPLFAGVDVAKIAKPLAKTVAFGLPRDRFAKPAQDSLHAKANEVIEIRLPAALLVGREFVVDAKLTENANTRLIRPRVSTVAPDFGTAWLDMILGSATGPAYKRIVTGNDEFRKVFPLFLCFPQVVPTDEVVTLKMFHREDEPLVRLFLNEEQTRALDKLWAQQRFISRQPVAEYDYLPQFMGYTTQDTPKAFQQFFIDRKPLFKKHAEEFEAEETAAIPKQLTALLAFAEKAYRRPLQEKEQNELRALYDTIRKKGATHDEAFRGVLSRVLVSPAFLFRIEAAPPGKVAVAVNDHELATRLSYFLWSSAPDEELRALAAAGRLRDPAVLAAQTQRMLKDNKTRALAIEFGTQSIHVRGFDEFNEKNEKLFPTFNVALRKALYEESILFFLDLFQADRPVTNILDADYTFVNDTLAKHYAIPGVTGSQWRKVDGVRKYGRGGILGFGSVQAKQAGASRTSPVLRGNWVVATLLGEKLPKPPANVPQLPEMEGTDKLTMRQQVERHAKDQACAVCHVRIDPYGFALEKFDPIGRVREKDLGGLAVDTKAKLKDGTEFDGIDGLRNYLLTKKKDVVLRLFCKRLLGYALGRAVTLSDTSLIDEMMLALQKNEGRVGAAVEVIVRSKQFTMVRGSDFGE
jgi:mono/diheme cytochrome c family protein